MKKPFMLFIFFSLIFMSACRPPASERVAATPSYAPPAPTISPSSTPATKEPPAQDLTPVTKTPVPPTPSLLQPTLLPYAWDNMDIFRSGLLDRETMVFNALDGASVYHLVLQIEDPTILNGKMEVRYTNMEKEALDDIYFHLFADELGGSINISEVTVNARPADTIRENTAFRIPLETPLMPGEEVIVAMNFKTTVPQGESTKYNILAYDEDILALAHFYPMIATYDERGWHIESSPPHGDETYADMSYYIVQVTAPADQTIAASGVEVDRSENDGQQNITLAAGPMRDFFLAMSDRFDVVSRNIGPVRINSYAPREQLDGAQLALDVTAQAVRSYSERFGPYPYTELDVVSTPTLALGVEYPGLFVNAVRIYDLNEASSSGTTNAIVLEATTAHETGHQWFYNLVGNDQLNEPWLDEALTQYATWTYFIDRYGEQNAQGFYNSLEGRWARNDFADIPIGLPAEAYSGSDYGAIVYGRGPIFLNELANYMGQETFDLFLRDYVDKYRWQIATSKDFQALAEQHCSCDLSSLFNDWVYGLNTELNN